MNTKDMLFDAASYWESKRLLYNGVLAVLAIACWGQDLFNGPFWDRIGCAGVLLCFCVIANLLFTLAYPVDLMIQMSPLKNSHLLFRRVLFAFGLCIAVVSALWVLLSSGMA
jgi:hypothetical protein